MADASETWDAIYRSGRAMRTWPSEDVVRFCARRLRKRNRQTAVNVLEAGCGNGANLWFLQKQGYEVTGVDASEAALKQAASLCAVRDIYSKLPRLLQMKLGALCVTEPHDASWQQYHAIIDCRASQHVKWSEHAPVYREYFQLLKPGGWLFLLHLDNGTTEARAAWPENERYQEEGHAPEPYTWRNIARGSYADNGLVCMPPSDALRDQLRGLDFQVARHEQLTRCWTEDGSPWKDIRHTAIDAQRPLTG